MGGDELSDRSRDSEDPDPGDNGLGHILSALLDSASCHRAASSFDDVSPPLGPPNPGSAEVDENTVGVGAQEAGSRGSIPEDVPEEESRDWQTAERHAAGMGAMTVAVENRTSEQDRVDTTTALEQ